MSGKIIYKPTCSECGAVIGGEVYGVRLKTLAEAERNHYRLEYGSCIHPAKCWKCGVWFGSIVKDVNDVEVVTE